MLKTIRQNEELLDLLNRLRTCGFDVVSMSGSGSTCFAFSNKKLPYKLAKEIIKKSNYELVGTYKVINKKIF
jgi:4-diphosphocytidyl-2C-methyl-D-erythritol kinase